MEQKGKDREVVSVRGFYPYKGWYRRDLELDLTENRPLTTILAPRNRMEQWILGRPPHRPWTATKSI